MALLNRYCTPEALKAALGMAAADLVDQDVIESAIEAASRQIDNHCGNGRKFWQDATVVARSYYPSNSTMLFVDDISTLTGLVVKVDTSDNGTFDTTLTINTDFLVQPINAAAEYPAQAWTSIRLLDGALSGWPRPANRPTVQVTAKFGWPSVPDAVERACVFQAKNVYKAPDQMFGSFQLAEEGSPMRIPTMDPLARGLLETFIRYDEVDDG